MKSNNTLIEKLLKTAKKHKILTYPVLALVAIISVINYFFSWSHGAGKRIVAVIMVMIMLVSQSYFLTSSATSLVDDENAARVQRQLQGNALVQSEEGNTEENSVEDPEEQTTIETTTVETTEESSPEVTTQEEGTTVETTIENADGTTVEGNEEKTDPEKTTEAEEDIIDQEKVIEDITTLEEPEQITILLNYQGESGPSYFDKRTVDLNSDVKSTLSAAINTLNTDTSITQGCYSYIDEWYYDSKFSTKVDNLTSFDPPTEYVTDNKEVQLFCKRKLVKYRVHIVKKTDEKEDDISYTLENVEDPNTDNTEFYVNFREDDQNGLFFINNLCRTGYDMYNVTVSNGIAKWSSGQDSNLIHVAVQGDRCDITVTVEWEPKEYDIVYYKTDDPNDDAISNTQRVIYDDASFTIRSKDFAAEKPGYNFSHWTFNGVEMKENNSVTIYQKYLYNKTPELRPCYTYDDIVLNDNKKEVKLQYQFKGNNNPQSTLIQGRYSNSDNSKDNMHFKYTPDLAAVQSKLDDVGITVSTGEDGTDGVYVKINDELKKSTNKIGEIDIPFTITDSNAPSGTQPNTFHIRITIDQCVVQITPDKKYKSKTYDATKDSKISVNELDTNINGITVQFTGSEYNESTVAGADRINLTGAKLVVNKDVAGGTDDDYALDKKWFEAEITPRNVFVKTYVEYPDGRDYICTGERDPLFHYALDTENNKGDNGFLNGDAESNLGEVTYTTSRKDIDTPGTYFVYAKSAIDSNYKLQQVVDPDANAVGSYIVAQDKPDGFYEIIGNKKGEYYSSEPTQIINKADSYYNIVKVFIDGQEISGSIVDITEALFANAKDIENIEIQLVNSDTGAYTSKESIPFKIDHTKPVYGSYTISQDSNILYDSDPMTGGLYFPTKGMVSFGNYFNTVTTITVKYNDAGSGLSLLHYGLSEDACKEVAKFSETDSSGNATASFELMDIVAEKIGTIYFYAEDIAGNCGETLLLKRDSASEWSVEATGPTIENFMIWAYENNSEVVENNSEKYYSNCKARLKVTDNTSGIYSVVWNVNGKEYEQRIDVQDSRQNEWTFEKAINANDFPDDNNGVFKVFATVKDNAQNTRVTDTTYVFNIDDVKPDIDIMTDYDKWVPNIKVEFTTSDNLSGIHYIKVSDADGKTINCVVSDPDADGIRYCYFETDKKGTYYIEVSDNAGNINKKTLVLDKVSSEQPECPTVTFIPEDGITESEWYNKTPSAVITNIVKTEDGTVVDTNYQLWEEGETSYNVTTLPKEVESSEVKMPGEGIYNLKVWSQSKTGQSCKDEHLYQVKVDTIAPNIDFKTTKGSGSTILVNFIITDGGSGVDKDSIKVLHGTRPVTVKVEETETGFKGSFEISETGNYSICASDLAGNVSDEAAFSPMSMKIKAVTNISSTGATLGANVIKGTFDIKSTSLSYRKYADTEYKEVEAVITEDEFGNVAMSAALQTLESGTAYAYKVVATSEADEVLVYEGYFKTLPADGKGISIVGTARYANNAEGMITVGLYEGNICVMAKEVNAGDEFTFEKVPDGNYNVVATDGHYTKTVRLLVKNGTVIYPEKYITLILSGKNTSVEITTDETPDITADNMDSIFEDDNVNFTDEDKAIIEAGGTVEFKLYATLMKVSSVSAKELAAMYAVTDKNKVVGAFLDLSLYKIVTDVEGTTQKSRVTKLASGANISITIPLGDLAGKPELEIIRIHNEGENFLGTSLIDQDTNPSTYTVTTNQFSTYAVLYSLEEATTEELTTEATTEEIQTTETSEEETTSTDEKPKKKPSKDKKKDDDKKSSVGSLRSPGSAKTGDETPIAVLGGMMLLSLGGLIVLRKKSKKIK